VAGDALESIALELALGESMNADASVEGDFEQEGGKADWQPSLGVQRSALARLRDHGDKPFEDERTCNVLASSLCLLLGVGDRRQRHTLELIVKAVAVAFSAVDLLSMPLSLLSQVAEAVGDGRMGRRWKYQRKVIFIRDSIHSIAEEQGIESSISVYAAVEGSLRNMA
jgi:hypothetical protein